MSKGQEEGSGEKNALHLAPHLNRRKNIPGSQPQTIGWIAKHAAIALIRHRSYNVSNVPLDERVPLGLAEAAHAKSPRDFVLRLPL
jgi:hypothetical protein